LRVECSIVKRRKRRSFTDEYVDDWSLWFDLQILWKTVPIVLFLGRSAEVTRRCSREVTHPEMEIEPGAELAEASARWTERRTPCGPLRSARRFVSG
jgi:hypothetical protein